jgi:rhodanese-related sulfurtransferase
MIKGRLVIQGLGLAIVAMLVPLVAAEEVPRMTKDELKTMLDDSNVVILDVRAGRDWEGSERKIKGSIRENPKRFESWAHKYSKDNTIVLYCA